VLNQGLAEFKLGQADADDESNNRIDIDDLFNVSIEEGLSELSEKIGTAIRHSALFKE